MNFDLGEDAVAIESAIASLVARYTRLPDPSAAAYYVMGNALDAELSAAGYFDGVGQEGFGVFEASLVVERVARSPLAVETAASLLVAPQIAPRVLPRPIALCSWPTKSAIRFLKQARTVIVDTGDDVRILNLEGADIEEVESIFAYPLGRFRSLNISKAGIAAGVSPETLRQWRRLAISVEMLGSMRSALDLTVDYVKQRQQFGKPIGAFQAVQHRLSACATSVEALTMLVRRAAWSGAPSDIAIAATYAQDGAAQLVYDCHQFHGAMGLTLEYALHHWTYRLKTLVGELGGASAQARAAARLLWNSAT